MNTFLLQFHSGLRWLILVAVIIAVIKSMIGLFSDSNYTKLDKIISVSFVGMMHLQLVLGLVLYFFYSSYVTYNMANATERFWSVEHLALMLFAVVAAQVGRSISKRTQDAQVKFRFQAIFFSISLLLMLIGIPWGSR